MKTLLLIPLLLASCTFVSHPIAGTYASLGGDSEGIDFSADGFKIAKNGNSKALHDVKSAIATYFLVAGAVDLANTAAGVANTTTKAGVATAKIDAGKSIKIEKIKAAPAPIE